MNGNCGPKGGRSRTRKEKETADSPDGPRMVTGAQGIWSGGLNGSIYQLDLTADTHWAEGVGCGASPTGTFTVADVAPDGSRLLLGFDMNCNGGTRRGCVSDGN